MVDAGRERPRRPDAGRSGRATGGRGMKAPRVASPTSRFRSLAGTDNQNLQTQSPWNPVRLNRSQLLLGRKVRGWNRSEGSTAPRLRLIPFAGQSMGRRGAENKSERAVDNGAGLLLPVAPERQRAIERVTHPRRKQARPTTSASQLRQTRRTCLRRSRLIRAVRDKRESPGIRGPVRGQPVTYEARKDLNRPRPNTCG